MMRITIFFVFFFMSVAAEQVDEQTTVRMCYHCGGAGPFTSNKIIPNIIRERWKIWIVYVKGGL